MSSRLTGFFFRQLHLLQGAGFRVQFRVKVSGFRVQGSGFRVQGSGFRVQVSGFRVQGSKPAYEVAHSLLLTPRARLPNALRVEG